MLIKAKTLQGYKLNGLDGEIGKVKEFYFDDLHWVIRYLVADPGNWLTSGRQVLISPYALLAVNTEAEHIDIDLTTQQIVNSPSLDHDKPVSQQFEQSYYGYYGWPKYWDGPHMWGSYPTIIHDRDKWKETVQSGKSWDPHLRSTHSVSGHDIQAIDGDIGHVEDFILDDETWAIRYLIIDTRKRWLGTKVLLSPRWIERVSWNELKVFVNISCEAIKQSPEYTEGSLLTRDYETELHQHYHRQKYWIDESDTKEHFR
jgi:hypothetical protein